MKKVLPTTSVVLSLLFAASCGVPGRSSPATRGPGVPPTEAPTTTRAARVYAPAPPRITRAMPGEPSPAQLAGARLVATRCEADMGARRASQIAEMRRALRIQYQAWHDAQPECWEEDRERDRERREDEAARGQGGDRRRAYGASLGDAWGSGYGAGSASPPSAAAKPTAMSASAGRAAPAEPAKAARVSGTNNQVASVDEADLVKTDGRYLYVAAAGALRIFTAADPKLVSVTKIPGHVREMFVDAGRAVVYASSAGAAPRCTYGYDCSFAGDGSHTAISVLDVEHAEAPRLVRTIDLSGSLLAARRIGSAVHTVVSDGDAAKPTYETWPDGMEMCGTPEREVQARFAKLAAANVRSIEQGAATGLPTIRSGGVTSLTVPMCGATYRTAQDDGRAYTSLVSFDVRDDAAAPTTLTLKSRPGAVFASESALYLAVRHDGATDHPGERSAIHKIRIGGSPKDTSYVGSGSVPGHVLSQLAMDEWHGYLRVATSLGRVPDPGVTSSVSVLADDDDGRLVRVGAASGIAPGEDIRAVRFDDDRAYVVTFKKTDPLFVLDLAAPDRPRVVGELEIPGFSTYLHRIDRDHLLSIGFDANDHGSFAFFDGVILQLFDVTEPTKPKLLHKEKIGTRGSSSEAAANHLAFNYFAETGRLAFPMTVCEGGGDGRNGDVLAFSGLLVYDVDVTDGFRRLGGVDHGSRGASCGTWWSKATSHVKRSVFVDDLVYSVAEDRMKVQRLAALGKDIADFGFEP